MSDMGTCPEIDHAKVMGQGMSLGVGHDQGWSLAYGIAHDRHLPSKLRSSLAGIVSQP